MPLTKSDFIDSDDPRFEGKSKEERINMAKGAYYAMQKEEIDEATMITKVTSKGEKTRRVKCPKGYKLNSNGTACVPILGSEKAEKRKAIRKAIRTKKAKGAAYAKRTTRKRLKALKRRKSYGL